MAVDILFCQCAYADTIPAERKRRVLTGVAASGARWTAVADLCGLAARADPLLAELARRSDLKIVACHPRAVRWLFHRAGAPLRPGHFEVLNLRTEEADAILSRLPPGADRAERQPVPVPGKDGDWTPWFPVIDYDRCVHCGQCLEFCLFGVYEADPAGKVRVTNPAGCKTNCPACARICPQIAILFPKVADSPINGAEIEDEAAARARVGIDIDEILGDNVYAALALRRAKRKALLLASGSASGDGGPP